MLEYWQKQSKSEPLFPNLIWSKPEQTAQAGKVLIIGGNLHGFAAPGEAYNATIESGVGIARVLLPQSIQKIVGRILIHGEYAPSTPSGSFSRSALAVFLEMAQWSDGTLLAGDFGRNSETVIMLQDFLQKHEGFVTATKDTIDYFLSSSEVLLDRPHTTLVLSFAQLQKLSMNTHNVHAFTFDMDLLRLVKMLHEFTQNRQASIVVKHLDTIFVACNGTVSSTTVKDRAVWRVKTAAHACVWQLQNPTKPYEALTTAIHMMSAGLQ